MARSQQHRFEKFVDRQGEHHLWTGATRPGAGTGRRRVRDIDEAVLDQVFGKLRAAGLSRSRLNLARSLYAPFFRWARSRRIITPNPMAEFQLPTRAYVSRERVPPEGAELSLLLHEAVEAAPRSRHCSPWVPSRGCGGGNWSACAGRGSAGMSNDSWSTRP